MGNSQGIDSFSLSWSPTEAGIWPAVELGHSPTRGALKPRGSVTHKTDRLLPGGAPVQLQCNKTWRVAPSAGTHQKHMHSDHPCLGAAGYGPLQTVCPAPQLDSIG